jgi:predicted nucleotidyltransferase
MRITNQEKDAVVQAIARLDPSAHIYLFGSRTDDKKRGGDIDILVISSQITFDDKLEIQKNLFVSLEEQKIDLVIKSTYDDPFVRLALNNAMRLQ